jgi:hypothetical protein
LAGYSLALCLPVMFLTQSRSGWIATVVGLAATTLLVAFRRRRAFLDTAVGYPRRRRRHGGRPVVFLGHFP